MLNAATSMLFVGALIALIRWSRPRQPQWCNRDASRFISVACEPDAGDGRTGRWTRVHGRIDGEAVSLRQGFMSAARLSGTFPVVRRDEADDARHLVYTLGHARTVHLRVPVGGPLAERLEGMLP
ncbi:MAG: hypothetical protein RL330_197 [Actinomycetota bacterium]